MNLVRGERCAAPLALAASLGLALATIPLELGGSAPQRVPAFVFVSRRPTAEPGAIPGFGPGGRAIVTGGRLLLRRLDGVIATLVDSTALYDVSDPAVSWDGARVAFAGVPHPDSAWRIYVVALDGSGLEPVTRTDGLATRPPHGGRALETRYDDLDPCWISAHTLVFASTRGALAAQAAAVPVTNLFTVAAAQAAGAGAWSAPRPITFERNGAEEPAFDRARGKIVYARWWFNRYRPSDVDASGITIDPRRAVGDSVNLWQAVEIRPDGSGLALAMGAPRSRAGTVAYQPAILANGERIGVYGVNHGLWPTAGGAGIQAFPGRIGRATRWVGATQVGDAPREHERGGGGSAAPARDPYAGTGGLAAPSACAPAGLEDGRVLFAYDPGARGDFGVWVLDRKGEHPSPVVDLPGTLELDPAPVPSHPTRASAAEPERQTPASDTFTYACENVFANGGSRAIARAAPFTSGAVLRFFAAWPRANGADDSLALVREVPVPAGGEVIASGLPARLPMFEQLVGPDHEVLRTSEGRAHVAGFNFGAPGRVSRCTGCHLGHSSIPVRERPGD